MSLRSIFGRGRILFAGILPAAAENNDIVSKDSKTYQAYLQEKPFIQETGWERIKNIFQVDEFGSISSELNSIYQAGFLGFLIGAIYGGVIQSRQAYMNFMESNQATAFKSHLDAKRKLQDDFTINFAKGGVRWGWRLGLFTTSYFGIVTCVSVYRGKSSIWEYIAAGTATGAMFRANLGLRGMIAGGVVGGVMGTAAGGLSLLILRASGASMEDIRYWQYQWRLNRDKTISAAIKKQTEDADKASPIVVAHDQKEGIKSTLDDIK